MSFKILVIDDEPTLRDSLEVALESMGHEASVTRTGEEGLELFHRERPDLVFLDHWLPGINGDEVLRRIQASNPQVPVVIMTAQGTIELAVQSMKLGAFDFLVKPFELDQVETVIEKGLERVRLKKEVEWLRGRYEERFREGGIVGVSSQMRDVLGLAERIARSPDTTVLIQGETGTGKELLAEYIHSLSQRASFPFVPVNCGAGPADLFESEFFGYEKGAFTGAAPKGQTGKVEAAEKGTLFLDEVEELPAAAQVKVLRLLEGKDYYKVGGAERRKADVRIMSATKRDLEVEARQGRFREDLYFRLHVVRLSIPPLRERRDDILPLFHAFLARFNRQFGKHFTRISPEAETRILAHPWNGNVRELRNVAERVVLLENGEAIQENHVNFLAHPEEGERGGAAPGPRIPPEGIALDRVIRDHIVEALRMTGGNRARAARMLGISRSALLYRMGKYHIQGLESREGV